MLLTEKHPLKTPFVFGGCSFIIDMAFNNILTIFEVLDDEDLNEIEKGQLVMYLLTGEDKFQEDEYMYDKDNLKFVERFLDAVFKQFIADGKETPVEVDLLGNPLPKSEDDSNEKSFDFTHDADYIFSSFMQAYNINLLEEHDKMHWEVFIALFNGLPENTMMMKVIDIREREMPTGKNSEKEAKQLRKAKAKFALPDTKQEED